MAELYDEARNGNLIAVKKLLKQGASANINLGKSLLAAASMGHHKVVNCLIDNGAMVDAAVDGTALIHASKGGHYETAEVLLSCGAEIILRDGYGKTALTHASENGHPKVMQLLLEKEHTEAVRPVRLLKEHVAQVNLCDADGCSPLLHASAKGHIESMKLLFEHGAYVDQCNKSGGTPLTVATEHTEAVKLLIEHGAQLDLQDIHGRSPLTYASEKGHKEATRLLRSRC